LSRLRIIKLRNSTQNYLVICSRACGTFLISCLIIATQYNKRHELCTHAKRQFFIFRTHFCHICLPHTFLTYLWDIKIITVANSFTHLDSYIFSLFQITLFPTRSLFNSISNSREYRHIQICLLFFYCEQLQNLF
jgi:hypothetical protein